MLHQSCSLIAFQLHFDCMKLLHFDCIFITLHLDCKNITLRLYFHYTTFGLHFDCTTIAMLQSQCNKSAIKVQSISLESWCNPTAFRVQSKCNVFFFAILWQQKCKVLPLVLLETQLHIHTVTVSVIRYTIVCALTLAVARFTRG